MLISKILSEHKLNNVYRLAVLFFATSMLALTPSYAANNVTKISSAKISIISIVKTSPKTQKSNDDQITDEAIEDNRQVSRTTKVRKCDRPASNHQQDNNQNNEEKKLCLLHLIETY